jgi:hypothetical protein
LGNRLHREVPFAQIDQVQIEQRDGQQFYSAADIYLVAKNGETLLALEGIPRAEIFRGLILEALHARRLVEQSLSTIEARHAG